MDPVSHVSNTTGASLPKFQPKQRRHGVDLGSAAEGFARSHRWTRSLPWRVFYRRPGVRPTSLSGVDTAALIAAAGTEGVDLRAREARDELVRRCWDKRTVAARRTLPALQRVLVGAPSQWAHPLSVITAAWADGAAGVIANYEWWCSECPSTRLDGRKIARSTWAVWRQRMEEEGWIVVIAWIEPGARGCKGRNETCIYVPGPKLLEQLANGAPAAAEQRRAHEIKIHSRQRGTLPRMSPKQVEIVDRTPASGEEVVVWDTPAPASAPEPEPEPEPEPAPDPLVDLLELATTPLVDIPDERLTPSERVRKADLLAVVKQQREDAARATEARIKADHARRDRHSPGWREEAEREFLATLSGSPSEPASSVQQSDIWTTTEGELNSKGCSGLNSRNPAQNTHLGGCAGRAQTCPIGQPATSRTSDLPKTTEVLPKTGPPGPRTLDEAIEGCRRQVLTNPERSD